MSDWSPQQDKSLAEFGAIIEAIPPEDRPSREDAYAAGRYLLAFNRRSIRIKFARLKSGTWTVRFPPSNTRMSGDSLGDILRDVQHLALRQREVVERFCPDLVEADG